MNKGIIAFAPFLLFVLSLPTLGQEIKGVNFVQEGEVSKLIIETDQENTLAERFHVSEDKQIILDLKNVKTDSKFLRGIDTSEFPGSTVFISGYKKPGSKTDIRFAIQLRDNVRSILENKGNSVVLNIENRFGVFAKGKIRGKETPLEKSPEQVSDVIGLNVPKSNSVEDILENLSLSGPKKYIGKRISINVRDIPVPDLLNMIADVSGFNIIIDKTVGAAPPLTLTLTNIPWDQALDTVMNLSKLVAEKNANILIIKTVEVANKEKEAEIAAAKLREEVEPLVTRIFPINYATLSEISTIVKQYNTKDRGTIQTDNRTNTIIVKDTVEAIERIQKIIATLDTQTPQILIESKIVEATEDYTKRLGLTSGLAFGYDPVGVIGQSDGAFSFSTIGNPVANIRVSVYKRLINLATSLELLESESKVRIISSPKIVTQNKKAATITSTDTTSFQQSVIANGATTTSWETATINLNLTVTPQVTNDGAISMELTLTKGAFGAKPDPAAPPNTTTRNLTTNVLVDNGSTVVIGGLYQTTNSESHSGIPILKDLPLIGWLFRTLHNPSSQKSELIVFMTPRIMNQEEAGFTERQAAASPVSNKEL